ncbi:hypothetical protein RDV89_18075 [Nocardioides zeae]|uniref:CBU-0592-like domain-containing protein n=1 Tax=Nocardioides imazamoxiresistens TaxID=3231893 RepID=A0ABU3Q1U2_9ACTN|nr:hypothetical protein [Nocardioides zeae]MDT9595002.1 hypothetical protein [Nocardioides zeae]
MLAAVLGWTGTIAVLVAFTLHSSGRMSSMSLRYATLNFVGGIVGCVACAMYGALPAAFSNTVWAVVAGRSLVVALRERRAPWAATSAEERPLEADEAVLAA